MKQIVAFIRHQRANRTRIALADAGFSAFTARNIVGRGRLGKGGAVHMGDESRAEAPRVQVGEGPMLLPCRMLSVVVSDDDLDAAIRTIIGTNKTGVPGDGKIFVLPVLEAMRVRTRECGDDALSEY
ncbi:MAG: P-II family nitrogen regulator [Candidatus Velthaea sp.]|jgi:nitrogen regulatory protein PII 2